MAQCGRCQRRIDEPLSLSLSIKSEYLVSCGIFVCRTLVFPAEAIKLPQTVCGIIISLTAHASQMFFTLIKHSINLLKYNNNYYVHFAAKIIAINRTPITIFKSLMQI